jgi:aarF domain-containing kinase
VVKVRHKNVKEQLIQDLKCLETIGNTVKWLDPDFDFSPVVREWSKEVPKELDFRKEAAYMERVSSNLHNMNKHASLTVEASLAPVIPGLTSERVMVMKFVDGIKISNVEGLDALGVDRNQVVKDITRAYACQIFVDGCFSGDPHPGNLLIDTKSRKAILLVKTHTHTHTAHTHTYSTHTHITHTSHTHHTHTHTI